MPEKVRRIKKSQKPLARKGLFFVVFLVIIAGGWWFLSFQPKDISQEKIIDIKDKETAALICVANDCLSLNKSAVAFSQTPRPSGALFFVLDDKGGRALPKLGEQGLPQETMLELLFLDKKIRERFFLKTTTVEIQDKEVTSFIFNTFENWQIKLSTENNANATLEILGRVLDELGSARANLEYVDLRLASKVFYKMK